MYLDPKIFKVSVKKEDDYTYYKIFYNNNVFSTEISLLDMIRLGESCLEKGNNNYYDLSAAILYYACDENKSLMDIFYSQLELRENASLNIKIDWRIHALYEYDQENIAEAMYFYYETEFEDNTEFEDDIEDLEKFFINSWEKLDKSGRKILLEEYLKIKE